MRIVRVARPSGPAFGVVTRPEGKPDHVALLDGHPFGELRLTDQVAPLADVPLLAPIIPSKILAIGKNYAGHAAEMGGEVPAEPLVFAKLPTTVIGPGEAIRLPPESAEVHHEAELAVVVGRLLRRATPAESAASILGYTVANDVTARDLQRRDGQFTRAKGFDSFCPLGPWIETELDPAQGLAVRCTVDEEVRQDGSTADLVFDVPSLLAHVSAFTTLLPGDVVLTGTPSGVGPIADGQICEVSVEGIGALRNPVAAEGG